MKNLILVMITMILGAILVVSCENDNGTSEPEGDTISPDVFLSYPVSNLEFDQGDSITIKGIVTDNVSVQKVEFYINDVIVYTELEDPYEYYWDTTDSLGNFLIQLKAYDPSGNIGVSASNNVKINYSNNTPVINNININDSIELCQSTIVICDATDADGDILSYLWECSEGTITGGGNRIAWTAPDSLGVKTITCIVDDGLASVSKDTIITVVPHPNVFPVINNITADPESVGFGETATIICDATDADDDTLSYLWESSEGTITGSGSSIIWTAPDSLGVSIITCSVDDGNGGVAFGNISVKTINIPTPGEMVLVLGDTFIMGDRYNNGESDELPVHEVSVSDFFIGKYEVTQSEWAEYMPVDTYDYGIGADHPVYYVSFYEVMIYCNKRSSDEGLTPCYSLYGSTNPDDWGEMPTEWNYTEWNKPVCNWSANGYRIPTEAEWEYAARGGIHHTDNFEYFGYNDSQLVGYYVWYTSNTSDATNPIGMKLPNQLGIYDMGGNIEEWTWDWQDTAYYQDCLDSGIVADPVGAYHEIGRRSMRGYSYMGSTFMYRVSGKKTENPHRIDMYWVGFRVVRRD